MAKKNQNKAEKAVLTPEEIAALREEAKAKFAVAGSETTQAEPQAVAQEEAPTQAAEAIQATPEQAAQEPAAAPNWLDFLEDDDDTEEQEAESVFFENALNRAAETFEEKAQRMADEEEERAQAEALTPPIMLKVAEQVQEIATTQLIEAAQKADATALAAEQAKAEARINAEALRIAQAELKQARAEAEAAKEAARIAEEQAELNRRLAPKILAAERAERIEQAKYLSTVLNNLESRKTALDGILRTADENITLKITGAFGQNVDFSNKNLCKEILTILREKVEEAINQKQTELNCFTF